VDFVWLMDHDTVSGAASFAEAAAGLGARAACGVEINTRERDQVHILGYGLRHQDPAFAARLARWRARRVLRAREIVDRLRGLGLDVSWADVESQAKETVGRPHVADALKRKGIVKSRSEAFERFLSSGKPGYVEPRGPSVQDAIDIIREFGGFAVLAHPRTVSNCAARILEWMKMGLEGLEVFYAAHRNSETKRLVDVAETLGLVATGGTDFHGPGSGRDAALGVQVPDEVYGAFLERLSRCC